MGATAINHLLRRRRRRLATLAVVLALGGAVAAHHLPTDHTGTGSAVVICLAVLCATALGVARVVGALSPHPRAVFVMPWVPSRLLAAPPLPRARSSPVITVVSRR